MIFHVSEIVDKAQQRKLREVNTDCELTYILPTFLHSMRLWFVQFVSSGENGMF